MDKRCVEGETREGKAWSTLQIKEAVEEKRTYDKMLQINVLQKVRLQTKPFVKRVVRESKERDKNVVGRCQHNIRIKNPSKKRWRMESDTCTIKRSNELLLTGMRELRKYGGDLCIYNDYCGKMCSTKLHGIKTYVGAVISTREGGEE